MPKTPPAPKQVVKPLRRLSPRIGRVYAWSSRNPRAIGSRAAWVPSTEYTLASVRAFCAGLK